MEQPTSSVCLHCKDTFILEPDLSEREAYYCPYCRAVILGQPDDRWLPHLTAQDTKRGFQPE